MIPIQQLVEKKIAQAKARRSKLLQQQTQQLQDETKEENMQKVLKVPQQEKKRVVKSCNRTSTKVVQKFIEERIHSPQPWVGPKNKDIASHHQDHRFNVDDTQNKEDKYQIDNQQQDKKGGDDQQFFGKKTEEPQLHSRKVVFLDKRISKKRSIGVGTTNNIASRKSLGRKKNSDPSQKKPVNDALDESMLITPITNLSYSWESLHLGSKRGSKALNAFLQSHLHKNDKSTPTVLKITPRHVLQMIESLSPKKVLPPPKGSPLHQIVHDLVEESVMDDEVEEKAEESLNKLQLGETSTSVDATPFLSNASSKEIQRVETGENMIGSSELFLSKEIPCLKLENEYSRFLSQGIETRATKPVFLTQKKKLQKKELRRIKLNPMTKENIDDAHVIANETKTLGNSSLKRKLMGCQASNLSPKKRCYTVLKSSFNDDKIEKIDPSSHSTELPATLFDDSLFPAKNTCINDENHMESPEDYRASKIIFDNLSILYRSMCDQVIDDGTFNHREVQILKSSAVLEKFKYLENKICELELQENKIIKEGQKIAGLVDYNQMGFLLGYSDPISSSQDNET